MKIQSVELSGMTSRAGFEITRVMFHPVEERDPEAWKAEIDERGED